MKELIFTLEGIKIIEKQHLFISVKIRIIEVNTVQRFIHF